METLLLYGAEIKGKAIAAMRSEEGGGEHNGRRGASGSKLLVRFPHSSIHPTHPSIHPGLPPPPPPHAMNE